MKVLLQQCTLSLGFGTKLYNNNSWFPVLYISEQYDTFVKFTHDQLMRRFGEQPASCEFFSFHLKSWLHIPVSLGTLWVRKSWILVLSSAFELWSNMSAFCILFHLSSLQMFPECGTEIFARRPSLAASCHVISQERREKKLIIVRDSV